MASGDQSVPKQVSIEINSAKEEQTPDFKEEKMAGGDQSLPKPVNIEVKTAPGFEEEK